MKDKDTFSKHTGEPYLPSNGTEGMIFCEKFCDNCINQHPNPDHKKQCNDILLLSLVGEQPKEWVYDENGKPTCTSFVKWDWDNDGDPDDRDNPKAPPVFDPDQLVLFSVADDILNKGKELQLKQTTENI